MSVFDLSKPGVAVSQSSFGGGWAFPLTDEGRIALFDFFDYAAVPLAPHGGRAGYIVEPYQTHDLAVHLREAGVAWEIK